MTFEQLEAKLIRNADKIVNKNAMRFHSDISLAWPVATGFSRSMWSISQPSKNVYWVKNPVEYSAVLWAGRIGNKGSWQLEHGGDPILHATRVRMMNDFKTELL